MRIQKEENGQILVMVALCLTVITGFLAFAIDVGLLFNNKRKLQNAVDAAATSAAIDYMFNSSQTSATASANAAITANQITNPTVTVHYYPNITSSAHNTNAYIEVIASQPENTFFMGVFNHKVVTVAARAIAGMPGRGNACVIVLAPTGAGAMTLQGSFDVSADSCGVVVDSSDPSALQFTGGAGTLSAGYVAVVGGAGGQTGDSTPAPVIHAAPVVNPFPSLSGPVPSTDCTTGSSGNTNTMSSINASTVYKTVNNITCFSNNVSMSGTVTLPSGIVVFENGVTLGGTVNSGANGTTIDNYGGTFDVSTGTTLNLTAPSNAPVTSTSASASAQAVPSGIALMQPSNNTNTFKLQDGNSNGSLTGIVYIPNAQLFLNDSGGDHSGGTVAYRTDLVVYQLYDKTSTLTIHSYTTSFGSSSPLTAVALVE